MVSCELRCDRAGFTGNRKLLSRRGPGYPIGGCNKATFAMSSIVDRQGCHPRGCLLTGSLIPGHLLTRDSESFGPRFWGPTLTLKFQVGPRVVSLELETFSAAANLSQVLATKAVNAKTPRAETLGVLC